MARKRKPGVFLSHTHADKPFVRRLAADLQSAGARIWIDEAELQVGDSLIEKIRDGIDAMSYVAVVLSPNSVNSPWVKREVDVAMNQEIEGRRIRVLPLLYRKCQLPGFLAGKLYADFTDPTRYHKSLAQLLRRLDIDWHPLSPPAFAAQYTDQAFRLGLLQSQLAMDGVMNAISLEVDLTHCAQFLPSPASAFACGLLHQVMADEVPNPLAALEERGVVVAVNHLNEANADDVPLPVESFDGGLGIL